MKLLKTCFTFLGFWSLLAMAYAGGIRDYQMMIDASQYVLLSFLSIAFISTNK